MVAVGDVWEGHELLNEERGMVRHFLARQVGDTSALVWLHIREGARLDEAVFAEEIARLQRLSDEVPEVVPVLYGGVSGSVAWAASPVLDDAVPLLDAARESELGPDALQVLLDVGRCLVRAHELSLIHGALSPDRVFVVGDGRYAITHFGFVRLFQLGPEEARHDPYGYAPPELLSEGRVGPRADVYGFGTLMYELVCKRALSPWTMPPSFPRGLPPLLEAVIQIALEENPRRRQPSIEQVLSVLAPFARAWEELGGPPELPHADFLAELSGARWKPAERAPSSVERAPGSVERAPGSVERAPSSVEEDEARPFASGEAGGRASALPTPRPSEAPDTLKSVMPPRGDVTSAPPLAAPRPPDTPDTLKSAVPPRGARDNATNAPPVAPPLPSTPDLPDLAPILLDPTPRVAPAPSTPPCSPVLPVTPTPSAPPRPSGAHGRRSPALRLAAMLALAFLLGSAGALLLRWEQPPRSVAAPHLARLVQGAALRATVAPPPRPADAPQAPPPVAPRSVTNRRAAVTRQATNTPSKDGDVCDGFLVCGKHRY
ncbi:serine/threonine protein kinase [Sorangium sp. So ce1024]|uniref:serine/threonine protein kinase n=1 Tax=unclassified Sorangium TaxID=2621164 RepID=UPI003EFD8755